MATLDITSHTDEINAQFLAISEDKLQGFIRDPLGEISRRSGVPQDVVIERIRAMLQAGTIRRVRQTLMSTQLASGALVAWQVPEKQLDAAFQFMVQRDPFSGHVVVRSTDPGNAGAQYRLWTTLKVPFGFSLEKHAQLLCQLTGCQRFRLMPARGIFTLGVGHVRRKKMKPGARAEQPAVMQKVEPASLSSLEWRVLLALKQELTPEEIVPDLWRLRAQEAGLPFADFCEIAESLSQRKILGRFSTFLEHVKPSALGERVTRFNALFHWAVPAGREIEAGREVGRHLIMTHCYWRDGGPDFNHVNIMGVVHGMDKELVLQHKAAIDQHLHHVGIPHTYTNVFWGGRSEIKPSEIDPAIYENWCTQWNVDPQSMRETD